MKTRVLRMATSRTDNTKYEHFSMLVNDQGMELSLWMSHNPEHALFHAMEVALHLGIECEPLVIDGKAVELDRISQLMLRKYRDGNNL